MDEDLDLETRVIEALPVVRPVCFHTGVLTHKQSIMSTSGVSVVRSWWDPSTYRAIFIRCVTFHTLCDCLREIGHRIERDRGPTCVV